MFRIVRTTALAATVIAASALPLLITSPAQADEQQCNGYLINHRYTPAPEACEVGAGGDQEKCTVMLVSENVSVREAKWACYLATQ